MNQDTMGAFLDEFEKISKVLNAITSISHISRRAGRLKQLTKLRAAREQSRHADLRKLLDSGKFDPKKHSMPEFMRYGRVQAKAPRAVPKAATTAETAVLPGSAMKPRPTMPSAQPPAVRPHPVNEAAGSARRFAQSNPRALRLAGLGAVGAGGYGLNAAVD